MRRRRRARGAFRQNRCGALRDLFLFVVLGAVFSLASVSVVTLLYGMAFGDDEELVPEVSDLPILLLLVLIPLSFGLAWAAVT